MVPQGNMIGLDPKNLNPAKKHFDYFITWVPKKLVLTVFFRTLDLTLKYVYMWLI